MFGGIVLGLGRVRSVEDRGEQRRLDVDLGDLVGGVPKGGSVAVNGACLTSVQAEGSVHSFDVIAETLDRTNLGRLRVDDRVNIELPLAVGASIDGHLVQGHVDTTAEVTRKLRDGDNVVIWFRLPSARSTGGDLDLFVAKGSVAIDGISLTLVDVDRTGREFSVALIPYTLSITTLGFRDVGDLVNIEIDHQAKLMQAALGPVIDELRTGLVELTERVKFLERGRVVE